MGNFNVGQVLLGAFVGAVVSSFTDPFGRAYERRTRRVAYWKALIDTAALVGTSVPEQIRQLCRDETAAAIKESQKLANRFAIRIATYVTLALIVLFINLAAKASSFWMNLARQSNAPAPDIDQIGFYSFFSQVAMILACWIWLRVLVRDAIWSNWASTGKLPTEIPPRFDVYARLALCMIVGLFSWLVSML